VRFTVGLDKATNALTPDQFGPEHPLRPAIDTMHWGWLGGFLFMAIEGKSDHGAFSYHLANDGNTTTVTVPAEFRGGGPVTLSMGLDVKALLADIDFAAVPNSSHSREGDVIVPKLRNGLQRAFRVVQVSHDLFQPVSSLMAKAAPAGTHPVSLRVPQRFPQLRLPADNPLTEEGIALGARLFNDTRLSINNTQSCASCHDRARAFADPRSVSVGAEGQQGKRNAMALFNLAWHGEMFWDGRAKTLRDQVLMPVQDQHEMNETLPRVVAKLKDDAAYKAEFKSAFGSDEISSERIAKALEQHLLSLTSQDSKFDRAARKMEKLTESEARGLKLFVTEFDPTRGLRGADCFHCHGGMLFTNHAFHNNGLRLSLEDIGREAVTKNAADRGKFKTPSLRNIALTAPYMHDGRFQTLEEVVEHYDQGVQSSDTLDPNLAKHPAQGLGLTTQEKTDLVAFLKTLTDESLLTPAKTLTQSPAPEPTR
jgi:cytochrome c peroxidase